MDNLFNFEEIGIDQDLLKRTNPIYNTAKMTLFQLAEQVIMMQGIWPKD